MKKTTLLSCGVLGLLGLGLTAQTVLADDITASTQGNVSFDVEWPVGPPVGPGPIEPPGPGGDDDEDLNIIYAMDFNFNERVPGEVDGDFVTYTSKNRSYDGNAVNFPAQPQKYIMADGTNKSFYGPLGVSIGNSGNIEEWSLYANASNFATEGSELQGLLMTLKDVTVNQTIGEQAATVADKDIELTPGFNVPVGSYKNVNSEEAENERSVNNFVFGSYTPAVIENGDIVTAEAYTGGVDLFIPEGKNIATANYVSNITWTLTQDPL